MSRALQAGLMGAAQGFMGGLLENVNAAKTERLRQARMAEERMLREEAARTQIAITPPQERVTRVGKEDVREQWDIDTSGPSSQWKGEFKETGRAPAKLSSKEVERKEGNQLVRYRVFEDGTEEKISEAPRHLGSGGNHKPQAFRPESGKGAVVWVKPGEAIPDGYVPANAPRTAEKALDKITADVAKEVRQMPESQVREQLNAYGIEAGPNTTLREAKRQLVEAMVDEQAAVRGLGGIAPAREESPVPAGPRSESPYPDGTRLQGPDGVYVVRNGVPVKES